MPNNTIKQLVILTDQVFDQNEVTKKAKKKHSEENEKLDKLKAEILTILDNEELSNFSTDKCKISEVYNESVKFPKEIPNKKKVFKYIEKHYGEDVLMGYLSINSAAFNSFFKVESEKAVTINKDFSFTIDGVEPPKGYIRLSIRKG